MQPLTYWNSEPLKFETGRCLYLSLLYRLYSPTSGVFFHLAYGVLYNTVKNIWLSWVSYFHRDSYYFWAFYITLTPLLTSHIVRQNHLKDTYVKYYWQIFHHQGGLERDSTNIAHACTILMVNIFLSCKT